MFALQHRNHASVFPVYIGEKWRCPETTPFSETKYGKAFKINLEDEF